MPRRSMTPGAKFSTRISALATISRRSWRPASALRLRVTGFLLELSMANGKAAPPMSPRLRRCSPPNGSTLITVAPAIAIMKVA